MSEDKRRVEVGRAKCGCILAVTVLNDEPLDFADSTPPGFYDGLTVSQMPLADYKLEGWGHKDGCTGILYTEAKAAEKARQARIAAAEAAVVKAADECVALAEMWAETQGNGVPEYRFNTKLVKAVHDIRAARGENAPP